MPAPTVKAMRLAPGRILREKWELCDLNAELNALESLQIVRGRKSSYLGSKYKSCTVRARCFGTSSLPSMNAS